jgi:hypothetical protein
LLSDYGSAPYRLGALAVTITLLAPRGLWGALDRLSISLFGIHADS